MSKLAAFLSELSDYELRAFHHFRFEQFVRGSQEKITFEMSRRGIPTEKAEEYLNVVREGVFVNRHKVCPRCTSDKFYTSHEVRNVAYPTVSVVDLNVDYRICLVCLYSQDKVDNTHGFTSPMGFIWKLINRKK